MLIVKHIQNSFAILRECFYAILYFSLWIFFFYFIFHFAFYKTLFVVMILFWMKCCKWFYYKLFHKFCAPSYRKCTLDLNMKTAWKEEKKRFAISFCILSESKTELCFLLFTLWLIILMNWMPDLIFMILMWEFLFWYTPVFRVFFEFCSTSILSRCKTFKKTKHIYLDISDLCCFLK